MTRQYHAVSDRILVLVDQIKEETFAGTSIIQAITDKDRRQHRCDVGEVVSIGPTAFDNTGFKQDEIKVGDRVKFVEYGGRAVSDPNDAANTRLRVIKIDDIYCKEVEVE